MFARSVVTVTSAPPASASAPAPSALPVLAALLAVRGGGLLAKPRRLIDRLACVLARLGLGGIGRVLMAHIFGFAVAGELRPLAAAVWPIICPLVAPPAPPAPARAAVAFALGSLWHRRSDFLGLLLQVLCLEARTPC